LDFYFTTVLNLCLGSTCDRNDWWKDRFTDDCPESALHGVRLFRSSSAARSSSSAAKTHRQLTTPEKRRTGAAYDGDALDLVAGKLDQMYDSARRSAAAVVAAADSSRDQAGVSAPLDVHGCLLKISLFFVIQHLTAEMRARGAGGTGTNTLAFYGR
jgi:hypothetical protein